MKIKEIINHASELYREERVKEGLLYDEEQKIHKAIMNADYDGGKNISHAEYNRLTDNLEAIQDEIDMQRQYCKGISRVRELLMDLGFDTEVE